MDRICKNVLFIVVAGERCAFVISMLLNRVWIFFSGNFAQLPVFALYNGDVSTQLKSRMSVIGQESTIEKVL